jgi:phosphoglycerate dehydrogenase-like enzyme
MESRIRAILYYRFDFTLSEELVGRLREGCPEVQFIEMDTESYVPEILKEAEIFVGWPNDEMLAAMPRLRWLQLPSAGANGYTNHPLLGDDVIITNSSGVFGVPGAEHAIALILAFARQLHVHFDQQNKRIWQRNDYCLEIQDSTAAVIGLGDIGGETALRLKALGAHVLGVKRTVGAKPSFVDELYGVESIAEVLGRADFVVNALPLTPETECFFSAERIGAMKKGALFINVGRGATVDESALITALQSGRLEGAGLDVTDAEPLPVNNPLWTLPNVIITSHSVGVSPRKAERRVQLLLNNVRRFLNQQPLLNVVDRRHGY